jgi:hypothetical protein
MCLVLLGVASPAIILCIVLLIQTGHLLSPLGLAWSHDGFRQIMRGQLIKYVALPAAILAITMLAAFASSYMAHVTFDAVEIKLLVEGPWYVPLQIIAPVYALWNAYHFGMQAFGVMSIYRRKYAFNALVGCGTDDCSAEPSDRRDRRLLRRSTGNVVGNLSTGVPPSKRRSDALSRGVSSAKAQRRIDMVYCCGVIWATMLVPFIPQIAKASHDLIGWPAHPHPFLDRVWIVYTAVAVLAMFAMLCRERCLPRVLFILTDGLGMVLTFWFGLWGFAIVAMNHWLVAIGLASHTQRRYPPTLFALALMVAGMALFCFLFMDLRTGALYFTVTAVGFRLGCGFVHFLYDRWLYKFSDAKVRATIGRDIFCLAPMSREPSVTS